MKANFRICPKCGVRNRLDKEYCVSCGESLEGVVAGDPADQKASVELTQTEREDTSPAFAIGAGLLFLTVAIVTVQLVRRAEPQAAPAIASLPSKPQDGPVATPPPDAPGSREYSEGMLALRQGDTPRALELLRAAVAAADRPEYRLAFAEALEKSGLLGESISEFERTASMEPRNARFTGAWGQALARAGRNTEAARAFDLALGLEPDHVATLRDAAALATKMGDLARARPYLERIVRAQPNDLVPKQDLARAMEAMGDVQGAIGTYRDILTDLPTADMTRALLSEALMKLDRPDDAIAALDEGLRLNASSALLHRERGRVFDRIGRNAEAIAAYSEYLRLAPNASDVRTFRDRVAQLSASGS
jgi:tetratricopeptide (TPR) repeat protein